MSTPNPEQTGPPLRALAMVLISLAILFAAIGALSLTGSDSDDAAEPAATETTTTQPAVAAAPAAPAPGAQAPATSTRSAAPTTSGSPSDVEVRVLNNSNISGLAAGTASTLTGEGWTVAETGNFSEAQFEQTAVYYGTAAGEQRAAQTIATQLGIPAEAKPASLQSTVGVVVIVTQ